MKALSIRQPWAHAILHLGKNVENRDWQGCAYRGPILLHASSKVVLRPTKREPETFGDAVDKILGVLHCLPGTEGGLVWRFAVVGRDRRGAPRWEPAPTLPLGGIVGRANIVDVLSTGGIPASRMAAINPDGDSPWYDGGFALVLADVEPLPFIPWKGSLGFFDVPEEVVKEAIARPAGWGASTC